MAAWIEERGESEREGTMEGGEGEGDREGRGDGEREREGTMERRKGG